jgi:hypothetical protein
MDNDHKKPQDYSALSELLEELERTSPMKSVVVGSEESAEIAVKRFQEAGFRLGAVSNAGLPHPLRRLTFLREECFTDQTHDPLAEVAKISIDEFLGRAPRTTKPAVDVKEFVKSLEGPKNG